MQYIGWAETSEGAKKTRSAGNRPRLAVLCDPDLLLSESLTMRLQFVRSFLMGVCKHARSRTGGVKDAIFISLTRNDSTLLTFRFRKRLS